MAYVNIKKHGNGVGLNVVDNITKFQFY